MRFSHNLPDWLDLITYYSRHIRGNATLNDADLNFVADSAEVILHLKASPLDADKTMGQELALMLASYFLPLERTIDQRIECFIETRDTVKKIAHRLVTSIIPDDHEIGSRYIREVEEYFKVHN